MSERFTVAVDIRAKDSTGPALKGAKSGFKETFSEIATGALRMAGEGLAGLAAQIPGALVDLGKLGIEAQSSAQRFERFAGGADRAAMFLESFDKGTENTVDRLSAMTSAGRLLQMGLVDTGDEMQQISSIATKLGDQTMGAGDRIADFAALLANQSIPRLDNFGISSGRVKKRIDELLKSGQALDREQAFKMAVMEEGAKSLQRLGDTSDTAASKIAVTTAAWKDTKIAIGGAVLSLAQASGALDAVSSFAKDISGTTEAIEKQGFTVEAWAKAVAVFVTSGSRSEALQEFRRQLNLTSEAYDHQSSEIERYASTLRQAAEIGRFNQAAVEQQTTSYTELSFVTDEAKASLDDQVVSQGLMLHTILATSEAIRREGIPTQSELESTILNTAAALEEEAGAADSASSAMMQNAEIADAAALSTAGLAASLKDATDAQIAQAAISELGRALREGEITVDAYATAVEETQLAFGLADEQSIFLTNSLAGLTEALASGALSADGYDEALAEVITQSETAGIEVGVFADALDGLPKTINIDIVTRFKTEGAPPSQIERTTQENIPEFQGGSAFARGGLSLVGEQGPELAFVPRGASVFPADQSRHMTNNFNLSVNSPASSMGVQNEFAMMQSLAA